MRIELFGGKYCVKADIYTFKLCEIKEKVNKKDGTLVTPDNTEEDGNTHIKNGKVYVDYTLCYPSTFSRCLEDILEREVKNNKCRTISGYLKHVKEVETILSKDLERIGEKLDQEGRIDKIIDNLRKEELGGGEK